MGSNQMSNLANSSNMGPLPQVSGCTFVVNPSRAISTNVSLVAVQYSSSTKTFPALESIPLTLYRKPENLFVAGFIGSPPMNLLKGKVQRRDAGLFFVEAGDANALTFPLKGHLEPIANKYIDKDIVFGIRPQHITNEPKGGSSVPVTLTVDISEPMGSEPLVYLKAGTGNLIARIHGEHLFHLGEQVTVQLDLEKVSLFETHASANFQEPIAVIRVHTIQADKRFLFQER
jgi:MalK OB fold domain